MAKTAGGVRTYRQGTSTYRKRLAEVHAMRASGEYSSVEMGKGGGWLAIEKSTARHKPEELEAARILADKGHRAISGLSMGGGGTAAYALHHPDLFGSACPMSGLLDVFPGPRDYEDDFQRSVIDNSPVRLLRAMSDEELEAVRSVRWWVDCGDDDFLWKSNVDFYSLMRERNIPLQYRMRDSGHTWRYWQGVLPDVLTFVTNGFDR